MGWFADPAALWALLGVPAVVFVHLYRRRHVELPVAALFLWEDAGEVDASGRVRRPLRTSASFWLEVLAALLLALAAAGFDPFSPGRATHVVAVLDDSASMGARTADGARVRDRVVERLEEVLDDAGSSARVTLVRSGARPSLLCGPGALLPEARAALADWEPAAPSHDLAPARALAAELADGAAVLVLTDRLPDAPGDARVEAFGAPADNVALLAPRREAGADGRDEVSCVLRSFASTPTTGGLRVVVGEEVLAEREVTLPPGASRRLAFEVPAGTPAVRLHAAFPDDALARDDVAVLHPPPRRAVRVGVALDEGLATLLGLDRLGVLDPDVVLADTAPDLVVAHEPAPAPAWSLVMPRDGDASEAYVGPFLLQRRHPLVEGLTLDGLVWTCSGAEPPGFPLVAAGNRPLLAEQEQDRARVYRLDAVMTRSTLHRTPDWPILLSNLLRMRRAALPGPRALNLVSGDVFECTATAEVGWELDGPGGRVTLGETDRLLLEDLPAFGDYGLTATDGRALRFAVNFADAAESDLADRGSGVHGTAAAGPDDGGAPTESLAGLLLLLGALGAVAADWLVLGGGRR